MNVKDLLGLGPTDPDQAIPASIWLPVAVVAMVLAVAILWILDSSGGLAPFLVIAVAAGLVTPTSALVARARRARDR